MNQFNNLLNICNIFTWNHDHNYLNLLKSLINWGNRFSRKHKKFVMDKNIWSVAILGFSCIAIPFSIKLINISKVFSSIDRLIPVIYNSWI